MKPVNGTEQIDKGPEFKVSKCEMALRRARHQIDLKKFL